MNGWLTKRVQSYEINPLLDGIADCFHNYMQGPMTGTYV
ncbi:hypothetical protein A11S_1783 [Micavibrio aeruginosavorus EPB]|uniref:Uncharacterized protein n=1 Tax=Micavibrio aeruginosavorus EPB TaxID=349215 RepID=M4VJC7_9BACT|nr:hypothetical protein A11S_1783 [Micavibrio aeruginosavorus EPB]